VDLFEKATKGFDWRTAMAEGGHLWAIRYGDMERAEEVRAAIAHLSESRCLVLFDTAVLVCYADGCVTLDGEPFAVGVNLCCRGLASFFAGLVLAAPPLTAGAAGALVRSAGGSAAEVGISDEFICEVQRLAGPGTSVLFVLDRVGEMAAVLEGIRGLGGTVLKTNVDLERAKLIQDTLASIPTDTMKPHDWSA
jgi:uncharacterized membrane protein